MAENTEKKEKLVEVELFKDNKDYKDDLFVCINGHNNVIKRGEKVKVPEAYKLVIDQSIEQDKATAKMMDAKSDEYAEETARRFN